MRRPEWTRCSGARPRDCDQECDPPEGRRATKVPLTRSGRRDSNPRPPPWQGSWGGLVTCGDGAICTLSSAFSIPCNPVVSRRFSVVDGTPTGPLLQLRSNLMAARDFAVPEVRIGRLAWISSTNRSLGFWNGVSDSGRPTPPACSLRQDSAQRHSAPRQVLGPIPARDNGHVTEAWPGDLYALASPRSPTRFAKVVGASPTLLYLRAYSAPSGPTLARDGRSRPAH
jgi:hypothetical protein